MPTPRTYLSFATILGLLLLVGAGCGSKSRSSLPTGSESVKLNPADFTTTIDNPYWPMQPRKQMGLPGERRSGNVQRVDITVTNTTKIVDGIEARVVHDVVTEDGQLVEDTFDWYAQDKSGNIWYLGEDTKEYENGKVKSTEGSWEAGVDGAQAGVVVPAEPNDGMVYRQEYYKGEAEDAAEVLSVGERVQVPFGTFENVPDDQGLHAASSRARRAQVLRQRRRDGACDPGLGRQRPRGAHLVHAVRWCQTAPVGGRRWITDAPNSPARRSAISDRWHASGSRSTHSSADAAPVGSSVATAARSTRPRISLR